MQSLAWKLAMLAGVVGVGFLVMLQAQRGMNQSLAKNLAGNAGDATSKADSAGAAPDGSVPAATAANLQTAPTPATGQAPIPAAPQAPTPAVAAERQPPLQSGEPPAARDPFSEEADPAKRAHPGAPNKPEAPHTAAAAPDLKQTGATADNDAFNPDGHAPSTSKDASAGAPSKEKPASEPPSSEKPGDKAASKPSNPIKPAADAGSGGPKAEDRRSNGAIGSSEPPAADQSEPGPELTPAGSAAPSAGPQLFSAGDEKRLPHPEEPAPSASATPGSPDGTDTANHAHTGAPGEADHPPLLTPGSEKPAPVKRLDEGPSLGGDEPEPSASADPSERDVNSSAKRPGAPKSAREMKGKTAGRGPASADPFGDGPDDDASQSGSTTSAPSRPSGATSAPSRASGATSAPSRASGATSAPSRPSGATSAPSRAGGPAIPSRSEAASPLPKRVPSSTSKNSNDDSDRPGPFRLDGNQASPVQIPKPAGAPNAAGAPNSAAAPKSAALPKDGTGLHPESTADFQGDGTIGEAAPLGPQRPQLSIEKVAPQNALIGQPLIYSIVVKNVGNSAARDVVVEDRIPKGTKLSGTIPRAELTGKRLIWKLGNLGPGEQRKISIRVVPLEAGEIGSVATVNFVAEAAAETVVTAPRLEFELAAPNSAKLGDMIPFHFKLKNVGTGEARGVTIRSLIPEGLSHPAGNDLEYEVGNLPPGKSKELSLELKAAKVGPTVSRAVVVGEGKLSVEAKAAIEIIGAKVAVSRSGPARRYLGRPAVYANTIVNESKQAVDELVVAESVPPGMEFAGATHGGQYNDGTRTVAWRIERMAPGETRVLKTKLIPKTPGSLSSTVRVTVPHGDSTEASSATIVEGFAAVALDVPAIDSPVDVGEKISLHVNARNKGTIAATNVIVTVDVPAQMVIVSARGPGKHSQEGNRLRFGPIPALDGRTAAVCEIVLEARERGDSRVKIALQADQIEKPLTREESVLILSESLEPAASR